MALITETYHEIETVNADGTAADPVTMHQFVKLANARKRARSIRNRLQPGQSFRIVRHTYAYDPLGTGATIHTERIFSA